MEIGSSGAGSLAQTAPTQTGSVQQVNRAEQQAVLETATPQESQPSSASADQRVGTVVDVTV